MRQLATAVNNSDCEFYDMDQLLENLFNTNESLYQSFAANIIETNEGYRIQAELPGFNADNMDVRIDNNLLTIEARNPESDKELDGNKKTWFIKERSAGNKKRSFTLSDNIDRGSIEAEMKYGILTINLNKKPEAKPYSIKVKN